MLNIKQAAKLISALSSKPIAERTLQYHAKNKHIRALLTSGTYFIEENDAIEFARNRPAVGRPKNK